MVKEVLVPPLVLFPVSVVVTDWNVLVVWILPDLLVVWKPPVTVEVEPVQLFDHSFHSVPNTPVSSARKRIAS